MDGRQSVITIIYAPTPVLRRVAAESLRATQREFSGDARILGVDHGAAELEAYAERHGWATVRPDAGAPPRMGLILRMCLDRVRTRLVWIIEHDAIVLPGARRCVTGLLAGHPEAAAIDCMTVTPEGEPTYPNVYRTSRPIPHPTDPRVLRVGAQTSLNCGCWRTAALRKIDWARIPLFPAVDREISRQVLGAGWELLLAPNIECVHLHARARRNLPPPWHQARTAPALTAESAL